jgi:hypothetical protein
MATALILGLLFGAASDTDAAKKEDNRDLKIMASGVWLGMEEKPAHRVIRGGEELAVALGVAPKDAKEKRFQNAATADTAKLLKVKDIDWTKQMLVVVAAGVKPTGGFRVEIAALHIKDKTLTVDWKLHSPAAGDIVTQAITHPSRVVLVERWQGSVRFVPPLEKK